MKPGLRPKMKGLEKTTKKVIAKNATSLRSKSKDRKCKRL